MRSEEYYAAESAPTLTPTPSDPNPNLCEPGFDVAETGEITLEEFKNVGQALNWDKGMEWTKRQNTQRLTYSKIPVSNDYVTLLLVVRGGVKHLSPINQNNHILALRNIIAR